MCLIGVSFRANHRFPILIAANRDEFHARPTSPAHWWEDTPEILAGRDRRAGGTWLGINRAGCIAAVTNLWGVESVDIPPRSRGGLVSEFLSGSITPQNYARTVLATRKSYRPFNLLFADRKTLHYVNSEGISRKLPAGIYAISNEPIGEGWPKTERIRTALATIANVEDPIASLLELLTSGSAGPPTSDFKRDVFVRGDRFGTRSSTVIAVSVDGWFELVEHQFDASGRLGERTRFREEITPPTA